MHRFPRNFPLCDERVKAKNNSTSEERASPAFGCKREAAPLVFQCFLSSIAPDANYISILLVLMGVRPPQSLTGCLYCEFYTSQCGGQEKALEKFWACRFNYSTSVRMATNVSRLSFYLWSIIFLFRSKTGSLSVQRVALCCYYSQHALSETPPPHLVGEWRVVERCHIDLNSELKASGILLKPPLQSKWE